MQAYETAHFNQIREAAPECMVLLKSDGSFPLKETGKLALYGSGARHTLKGGTGSGDVYVRTFKNIEECLEEEGFTITTKDWLDGYDRAREEAHEAFLDACRQRIAAEGPLAILDVMGEVMPEPEYELPLETEAPAAVYVLSRVCGEGSDRKDIKGDFRLTDSEIRDIGYLARHAGKFLLVLNTGGVVDLAPVADKVKNLLLLSMPGMAVAESFADVLLGRQNPSGKLTATWSSDYSFVRDFGCPDDTRYAEGIYSGYRGFDMFEKQCLFPFGFGLSYTTFQTEITEVTLDGSRLTVMASVTNTGDCAGKEVVQVYVSVPQGKLDHPLRELAGFAKTPLLQPGETALVPVEAELTFLASYDRARHVRFLEQGEYLIFAGCSLTQSGPVARIRVPEEQLLEETAPLEREPDLEDPAVTVPETWQTMRRSCEEDAALTRLTLRCRKPEAPDSHPAESVSGGRLPRPAESLSDAHSARPAESLSDARSARPAEGLSDEQLAHLCVGGYQGEGSKSVLGNAGFAVAGAAGQTTGLYEELGIPSLVMADGPAGLRIAKTYGLDEKGIYAEDQSVNADMRAILPESVAHSLGLDRKAEERGGRHYTQYCSAIPVGTALAQSFNTDLAEAMGDLVGEEMERFGIHLWLAPALNIQRYPLCGRNFEYYSEDPLISGRMAGAVTRGVQAHPGCGTVIKHFCANNQETNRFHSNSVLSERTLRDLYLKGFELAVKESRPACVMSSYNLLNGEHTSQSSDLLRGVLRGEWGYDGLIMSDWVIATGRPNPHKYPSACASKCVRAGNDLMMPGGPADIDDIADAMQAGALTREDLIRSASRVIALAQQLGRAHAAPVRDEVEHE